MPKSTPKKQQAASTMHHVQQARAALQTGEVDRGIKLYQQAIQQSPREAGIYSEFGMQLYHARRIEHACRVLEQSLDINPRQLSSLQMLGQIRLNAGHLAEAQTKLHTAHEIDPNNPTTNVLYGTALYRSGDPMEAIKHFRTALTQRLANPPAQMPTPPSDPKDFNRPETERLMWDTLATLAENGIHAFASYGTLLGLVRDGELLPFDKDFDFGLPFSEIKEATACLEANGWVQTTDVRARSNSRGMAHKATGHLLDLCGFVVDPGTGGTYFGLWFDGAPYEWGVNARYPTIHLKKGESPQNRPVWVLQDPEPWMELIYGSDWRTPDPDFDAVVAAKNTCGPSPLWQCYAFQRIYNYWEQGATSKMLATCKHALRLLPDDSLLQNIVQSLEPAKTPPATNGAARPTSLF